MSAPRGVSFTEPRCRPADLARCLEAARDLAPWLGPAVAEAFHRLRAPRQGRGFHVGSLSLALALRAPSTSPARPLQGKRGAEVARANALACALLWSLHACCGGGERAAIIARGELRRAGVRC